MEDYQQVLVNINLY